MAPVYPQVRVYLDNDRDGVAETDISAHVVSAIEGGGGLYSAKETDRTPSPGSIRFDLENVGGVYADAPNLIGKSVSVQLVFGDRTKQAYFGFVTNAEFDSGFIRPLHVHVTVSDWLYTSDKTRVKQLALQTFKRANEALPTLLDVTANPPARTDYDAGTQIFPNMFDGGGSKAKVFSELDKIAKSELGYLYLKFRPDGTGEVLRFENFLARGSTRPLSRIPIDVTPSPLLQYHGTLGATGLLKYHGTGGTSGFLKTPQAQNAVFTQKHYDAVWNTGKGVVNEYNATNVLRNTDTTEVILYTLGSPIEIGTGEKKNIGGGYSDPNGGTVIQAYGVLDPVATTDYQFWSERDGTGTDLTANLTMVFNDYTNNWQQYIRNNGPAGYLTFYRVRGKGIYKYNPTETTAESVESKENFVRTEISESINREYSSNLVTSLQFVNSALALHRHPTLDLQSVSYHGNDEEMLLMAFMYLEQGDKVRIDEAFPTHTGDYYIQGVKFKIQMGGIVDFTWYLKEEAKSICTAIAVATPAAGKMVALDFGILPHLANLPEFSYSCWVRRSAADSYAALISRSVDTGAGRRGNETYLVWDDFFFKSYKTPTDGNWTAFSAAPSLDVWYHLVITYDNGGSTAAPRVYSNGTELAVTTTLAPAGASDDDSDCPVILFNVSPAPGTTEYYIDYIHGVAMKDVRIYNRILTPAEVSTLAAAEDGYLNVQEGLLFNGIFAPTGNIEDYVGATLENEDLVVETVHSAAGTPYSVTTDPADMLTGEYP
jgi:hypothetical protein